MHYDYIYLILHAPRSGSGQHHLPGLYCQEWSDTPDTLVVLIVLVLGEMIWGITGLFLSIPVIAIFKAIFDRVNELNLCGILLGVDDNEPGSKPVIK